MQETIWFAFFMLIVGFILIIKGGDFFVDAAVYFAEITKIPKMLIGATVISLCTTLPELLVSTMAVTSGVPDIGIGNALGSIICNTALILGISASVLPASVHKNSFRAKSAFLLFSILMLFIFMQDLNINLFEGILLAIIMFLYIFYSIMYAKHAIRYNVKPAPAVHAKDVRNNTIKFVLGVAGIIFGARFLVNNATIIAHKIGISDQIIGLTIVALGTSLPELATTVSALIKKEFSLSVGNVIGANILNIVMILSMCSIISPSGLDISMQTLPLFNGEIPQSLMLDLPIILVLSLLVIIPAAIKGRLYRWQGIMLLTLYAGYIGYLALGVLQ